MPISKIVDLHDELGAFVETNTPAQVTPFRPDPQAQRWSLTTRVAFRLCFVYFGLFCISTQIFGGLFPIPKVDIPDLQSVWPIRPIVLWVAAHILRVTRAIVYTETGSGDRTFDWIVAFFLLVVAVLATAIWSVLDRRRENYTTLYKWFRLFLRFALASQMLAYGLAKAVPLQMPFPNLTKLLEPFGNFSPMGVLWASIGSAQAYEIFAGCAEMLGGILLIFPRTTMLGALVCLADMTQVFMLNMTYDVPVKLFSFHLILLAVLLLAPDLPRVRQFFLSNCAVGPSAKPQLFRTLRANRIAFALQIIFGIWIAGTTAYGEWDNWPTFGGGRPKPPLYGIWDVQQLSIDNQMRSPLLNDYDRWRRVIFDFSDRIAFQRMDDSFARYTAAIDINDKTLALTKGDDKSWKADFQFQRLAPDQLALDGHMDGHTIHMQLQLFDRNKFLLISRGFHWIQENPYNR
jgi:uncharacterized membrane protein YphA (DoxX/SURF4 family)